MLRILIVTCALTLLLGCDNNSSFENAIQHWYLVSSDASTNTSYVELKFMKDSVSICRDGYYWITSKLVKDSNTYMFESSILLYEFPREDSLVLEDELGGRFYFSKVKNKIDGDSREEILFRRLQFYARNTPLSDSSAVEDLKYDMWNYFGGETIPLEIEDIEIEKRNLE